VIDDKWSFDERRKWHGELGHDVRVDFRWPPGSGIF
jgi:hypothetical protein